jgi:hypothetical protein
MQTLKELFSSKNFTALSVISALASGCLWHLSTRPVDWLPWDLNALAAIMAIASAILAVVSIVSSVGNETSAKVSNQRLALIIGRIVRAHSLATACDCTKVLNELDAISANAKNEETRELAKAIACGVRSCNDVASEEDQNTTAQA